MGLLQDWSHRIYLLKMNVFEITTKSLTAQATNNLPVNDAWTILRCEFVDIPTLGDGNDTLTFKVEEVAQGFNDTNLFTLVGGDNEPIENVNPEVIPVAVKGDFALWFDTDLNTAEEELEDYEYVMLKDGTAATQYLVFGKLNVSKTDFYTPDSETKKAHYFRMKDDISNY